MNIELKALSFAYKAHINQKRKYTGEPYITHPVAVAGILKDAGFINEEIIAAALLHDVVEDTPVIIEEIARNFGVQVAKLVDEVTDVSAPEDGNRKARKKLDLEHLAKASSLGQNIKLADLIHNTPSICQHDKGFAKKYLQEKEELLKVLTRGTPYLRDVARQVLEVGKIMIEVK